VGPRAVLWKNLRTKLFEAPKLMEFGAKPMEWSYVSFILFLVTPSSDTLVSNWDFPYDQTLLYRVSKNYGILPNSIFPTKKT